MKKLFSILLSLFCIAATAMAADRAHTLKIYNWADYIDESVLEDFKVWYKEETGEEVDFQLIARATIDDVLYFAHGGVLYAHVYYFF